MVSKKFILLSVVSLISVLIAGCDGLGGLGSLGAPGGSGGSGGRTDDNQPINLLRNFSAELGTGNTPAEWWNNPATDKIEWASEGKAGTHSLRISYLSNISTERYGSYWAQTITNNIPVGKMPVLKAFIKGSYLSDNAVAISIRGDDPLTAGVDYSCDTVNTENISGTFDWKEYTLKASTPVPANIRSITVYLVFLPDQHGIVYFDDIRLYDY